MVLMIKLITYIRILKIFKKLNVMVFLPYKILNDDFLNKKKTNLPFNLIKRNQKY